MKAIYVEFVPEQTVWVMYENRPVEAVVNSVKISIEHPSMPAKIQYSLSIKNKGGATYSEEFVFATKEELKESIFG